jgi:hypothetical protein
VHTKEKIQVEATWDFNYAMISPAFSHIIILQFN